MFAAPPAVAQTAGTLSLSATGSGGDRDSTATGLQVDEGDTITLTITANGLTAGRVNVEWGFAASGTAAYSETAMGGDFYSSDAWSESSLSARRNIQAISAPATTFQTTFTITDDPDREDAETIVFSFGNDPAEFSATPATFTNGDNLTVTIRASDPADRNFAISVDNSTASEGDTVVFTVSLTGEAPTTTATVDWAVSGAGITAADYEITGDDTDGTLSFTSLGDQTLRVRLLEDLAAEGEETLTITLSNTTGGGGNGNHITTAATTTTIAASTVVRRLTLTGPATAEEGEDATYTVSLEGTAFANPTAVTWTVMHGDTTASDFAAATGSIMFPTMTTFAISVRDDDATDATESAEAFSVQISTADGTTVNAIGAAVQTTIGGDDDPAAREARLDAPLASAGRGVGQLASQAVAGRLAASVSGAAGGNSLTIAGRDMTAGAEVLAAQFLASGYATGERDLSAAELLRQSGFNLIGGDGAGRGFNFWGGGEFVSAEGAHDGIDYDGDTSAFTVGIDTNWKNGLVGVAVSRSDGDVDFTVTADGSEHTLETTVTSMHPYLTHRLNNSQLWLTAGHGSGDAELKEPDATIKTDITVTTAALGLRRAHGQLAGDISALYTRAELDAVASGGRALPKTTADSWRVAATGQARWQRGAFSPFVDFTVRHDSGDGDTGIAGDLGGGVEWNAPTVQIRLTAATTIAAKSAEESRASLTVRKSSGNFDLGLNLSADDSGLDTGRLLTGEWRF